MTAATPRFLGPRFRGGNERGGNPSIAPPETPLRYGPLHDSGHTAVPRPPLSRGKRTGREPEHPAGGEPAALRSVPWQRHHRGSWAPAFLPPRFPGERRDPGTTEHWMATRRTSSRQGLCGTEGAFFLNPLGHRAGGKRPALRPAP